MTRFRAIVILLLAILLPARVVVAAVLPCLPQASMHHDSMHQASIHQAPVHHEIAAFDAEPIAAADVDHSDCPGGSMGSMAGSGQAAGEEPPGAHGDDAGTSVHGDDPRSGNCPHCLTGCCLLSALDSAFRVDSLLPSAGGLPTLTVSVPEHRSDGPERPPRRL